MVPRLYTLSLAISIGTIARLVGLSNAFAADNPSIVMTTPSCDTTIHVSPAIPQDAFQDGFETCRLVEIDRSDPANLVDCVPAINTDGMPDSKSGLLLASIPPGSGSDSVRRFRIDSAKTEPRRQDSTVFQFDDENNRSLGLRESDSPVLVYNYGIIENAIAPATYRRSSYLHPIHGLDGEVLTDDFPPDHFHHRGLFWAWPHVRVAEHETSLWALQGVRCEFSRWLFRHAGRAAAVLGVENGWHLGDSQIMIERVWLRIYRVAERDGARAIDVDLYWTATDLPVVLWGAEDKSYGGLSMRFGPRKDTLITTPDGVAKEDLNLTCLPWADLSGLFSGATKPSGIAVFIESTHPDYPPMWITRHYGFLGVGWPGVTPATLQPGRTVHLGYRIWIHRGQGQADAIKHIYQSYLSSRKATATSN
jgi:hypothetical protein